MSLKSFANRDNMSNRIHGFPKSLEIPGAIGLIDIQITLLSWRRRLLESIAGIGDENDESFGSSQR